MTDTPTANTPPAKARQPYTRERVLKAAQVVYLVAEVPVALELSEMLLAFANRLPSEHTDFGNLGPGDIPPQRAWDLLRCMRHHLRDEGLISLAEFGWLVANAPGADGHGSPAPRRLEDYDKVIAELGDIVRERDLLRLENTDLRARIAALEEARDAALVEVKDAITIVEGLLK